jgi:hypothetical protein
MFWKAVTESSLSSSGGLVGAAASASIVALWLVTFHKNFLLSLAKTQTVNGYGVYTDLGEALRTRGGAGGDRQADSRAENTADIP